MNSIAHHSPIVREIVKSIFFSYNPVQDRTKEKYKLDTSLIPHISEKVLTVKEMNESILQPHHVEKIEQQRKIDNQKIEFIHRENIQKRQVVHIQAQKNNFPPIKGYGRLANIINDPAVSYIECSGSNAPVSVVKFGRQQLTNIYLSKEEIKSFLEFISERANIPLSEGVFKVVLDDNLVSAVISEATGINFMIKKHIDIVSTYGR